MADREYLTEPEAAALLERSAKTLARWRKAGAVGHILTPGGRILYRREHIVQLLADMEVAPTLGRTSPAVS